MIHDALNYPCCMFHNMLLHHITPCYTLICQVTLLYINTYTIICCFIQFCFTLCFCIYVLLMFHFALRLTFQYTGIHNITHIRHCIIEYTVQYTLRYTLHYILMYALCYILRFILHYTLRYTFHYIPTVTHSGSYSITHSDILNYTLHCIFMYTLCYTFTYMLHYIQVHTG